MAPEAHCTDQRAAQQEVAVLGHVLLEYIWAGICFGIRRGGHVLFEYTWAGMCYLNTHGAFVLEYIWAGMCFLDTHGQAWVGTHIGGMDVGTQDAKNRAFQGCAVSCEQVQINVREACDPLRGGQKIA